ncbi:uncharacterized protein LOC141679470 [Apium graveolens]|uniref:uncharacterized protein LOC141679470 n=1 Tax=Apium graveolens TaxID=4045 RepID=UPI003D7AE3E3
MTDAEQEFQQVLSRVDVKPSTLYTDGASNVNGTGLRLVLKSPQGDMIAQSICYDFKAMNNEAEYEALIMGLTIAKDMKIENIDVNCDSLLVVNHVKGSYEAKDPKMVAYLDITNGLTNHFDNFSIQQVPRENNVQADVLAGLGAVFKNLDLNNIPVIHIVKPAMERLLPGTEIMTLDQHDDDTSEDVDNWIKIYKDYLQFGIMSANNNKARVLRMKASRFTIIDGKLFKKSSTGLLQRCLTRHEADMMLRDAHEGECGNHTNGRNMSLKILRLGYYWTTPRQDALDYAKKCDACQRHALVIHQPYEHLHMSIPSWPFMKWGMNIVGKMPPAPGQKVFMLAMIDYFSKWIEAEIFKQVTSKEMISFIKRNMLYKFGIPYEIVCDNGSQFISDKTEVFCKCWNIDLIKSTPRYPQANG